METADDETELETQPQGVGAEALAALLRQESDADERLFVQRERTGCRRTDRW